MRTQSINNRYELLKNITQINNLQRRFDVYEWYEYNDWKISKNEHWSRWQNDYFNFVDIWAKNEKGKNKLGKIKEIFTNNGYECNNLINGGLV